MKNLIPRVNYWKF
nr:unnamed protein product [Callosobruchus chinensis]